MFAIPTSGQTSPLLWLIRHLDAARGALGGEHCRSVVAINVVVGIAAYFGLFALIAVPTWTIVAFAVVTSVIWRFWDRIVVLETRQMPKLVFFTGEHGSLRLNEDILSSAVVYCIGLRNEGLKTVRSVSVGFDNLEGHPRLIFPQRLAVFGTKGEDVNLHPGEVEYFCVARIIEAPDKPEAKLKMCFSNDPFSPVVPVQSFVTGRTIALSAYGDGVPKTLGRLQLIAKHEAANWSLDLKLLPNDQQAAIPPKLLLPRQPNRAERPQKEPEGIRRLLARQSQASMPQ